jgi:hypothetical protein
MKGKLRLDQRLGAQLWFGELVGLFERSSVIVVLQSTRGAYRLKCQ